MTNRDSTYSEKSKSGNSKNSELWMIKCADCAEVLTRNDALTNNVISSLHKFWHRNHFNCQKCSASIGLMNRDFRPDPEDKHRPLCIDCFLDSTSPPCAVYGEFLQLDGNQYDEDCYFKMKVKSLLRAPETETNGK
uniref:LIM zinc-binding domain-containing protein n=1 Tax=Ditylenchus dipsaci TaxID=166011 RepID=A0A915D1L1_9BILA